jgi:hypothetical protein
LSTPARKKPRLEEPLLPLPRTTDETTGKATSPESSEGLYSPTSDNDNDDSNEDPLTDTQPNAGATGCWTPEEDAKLTSAVTNTCKRKWGKVYVTDWIAVAALVPGRTNPQCSQRWRYKLVANIDSATARTGSWTEDEDNKLTSAVETHGGKNWDAIAALVPGRARTQCYKRWHDVLDPKIVAASGRKGSWTEEEDSKLKGAVHTQGNPNWVAVAVMVPGRSRNQCRNRFHYVLDPNIGAMSGHKGHWTAD